VRNPVERGDRIVISLPERKLTVMHDGRATGEYEIAVGKPDTPTPTGDFQIADKQAYAGINGAFGTRWMEFHRMRESDGVLHLVGIHGTNAPQKIGDAVSHGCIRLNNDDVEKVYRQAYIGEPVEIIDAVSALPPPGLTHPPQRSAYRP
jgi:lipoprotein-anchoring transpeptidase ErfK/SrfK